MLGTLVWTAWGWPGFVLLAAFVALGSAATRLGWRRKLERRLAQAGGGRRSARHALANAGVAAAAALGALLLPHPLWTAAFAAALATATGDTLSSEIGQLWGGRPWHVTRRERVAPGTDGAVSAAGSAAGIAGSLAVAVLGWAVGLYGGPGILRITLAGLAGNAADTVLGATSERWLGNEGVNFLATLVGALLAAVVGLV